MTPESTISMRVLDARLPQERDAWLRLWNAWPGREVFAHPDYVRLFARPEEEPRCAVMETPGGGVLFPFLLRPLVGEVWSVGDAQCDLTSPLGYGGAFAWGRASELEDSFWAQFRADAQRRRAVCGFARLSLFAEERLGFPGVVETRMSSVVRTLNLAEDELLRDYRYNVRRSVRQARTNGLRAEIDLQGKHLADVVDVHRETMDRRRASQEYYFTEAWLHAMIDSLPGQFAFAHVWAGDRLASMELVLISNRRMYSFLGGTRKLFFDLSPNYLLKHELHLWGRDWGLEEFVLGGGPGRDDGVFEYKKRFAPGGVRPFQVGMDTFDADAYARLVAQRQDWEQRRGAAWGPDSKFFPAYRASGG